VIQQPAVVEVTASEGLDAAVDHEADSHHAQ
jgi:hypothetical protein